MSKQEEASEIIKSLELPRQQQNERSSLTLLALAELREGDSWQALRRPLLRTVDIMSWMREHYKKDYKPNSRETIRRQTIHQFEQARIVDRNPDDPKRPTNSGDTVYQLTEAAAVVLKSFSKKKFTKNCERFIEQHGSLSAAYQSTRDLLKISVTLPDGSNVELSPGSHNELQRCIVEEFASRFAQRAILLYLGDTAEKRALRQTKCAW